MDLQANKAGIYPIYQKPAQAIGLSTPAIGCVLDLPGLPGGGNKIYDRSPYGNIGTITGATWKRLPSGLWVLHFDGIDDYVNCGSGASLDFAGAKSIVVWIYPEEDDIWTRILCAPDSFTNKYFLIHNVLKLGFGIGSGANEDYETDDDVLVLNNWYQVVVTYDGTMANTKIYVNGIEKVGSVASTGYSFSGTTLWLGARQNSTAWYEGYIALPRILNRALSTLEIQNSYNREKHLFGV